MNELSLEEISAMYFEVSIQNYRLRRQVAQLQAEINKNKEKDDKPPAT